MVNLSGANEGIENTDVAFIIICTVTYILSIAVSLSGANHGIEDNEVAAITTICTAELALPNIQSLSDENHLISDQLARGECQ